MKAENKEKFLKAWMDELHTLRSLKYTTININLHRTVDSCIEQLKDVILYAAEETYGKNK